MVCTAHGGGQSSEVEPWKCIALSAVSAALEAILSYNGIMRPAFRDAMGGGLLGGTCLMVIVVVLSAAPGGEAFLCPAAVQRHGAAASSSTGLPSGIILQQRSAVKTRYYYTQTETTQTWDERVLCNNNPTCTQGALERVGSLRVAANRLSAVQGSCRTAAVVMDPEAVAAVV